MQAKRSSFFTKLWTRTLVTLLVLAVPGLFVVYGQLKAKADWDESRRLQARAGVAAALLASDLEAGLVNLTVLSQMIDLQAFNSTEPAPPLELNLPGVVWAGLADKQGHVLSSTRNMLQGGNVAARPWFQKADSSPVVLDIHDAKLLEALLPVREKKYKFVDMALPIYDPAGNKLGVLGVHFDWDYMVKRLVGILKRTASGTTTDFLVLGSENELRLTTLEDGPAEVLQALLAGQLANPASNLNSPTTDEESLLSLGGFLISKPQQLNPNLPNDLNWKIFAVTPAQTLDLPIASGIGLAGIALFVGAAITLLLSLYYARRFKQRASEHLGLLESASRSDLVKFEDLMPKELLPLARRIRYLIEKTGLQSEELSKQLRAARQSEHQIRELIRQAPVPIAMFDTEMRYITSSAQWNQSYLAEGVNPVGMIHYDLVPDVPSAWLEAHQKGMRGESLHAIHDCWVREDSREIWLNWSIEPWHDSLGRVGGIIVVTEDVTEKLSIGRDLEQARIQAEAARLTSESKSKFVALVSHEIRNPLNGIIGLTRLLEESATSDLDREHLQSLADTTESLKLILNDILDYSKIEAGQMDLRPVQLKLDRFITGIAALSKVNAEAKGLQFVLDTDLEEALWVEIDSLRLRQVIQNLLSNAVKFTEAGEVGLSIDFVSSYGAAVSAAPNPLLLSTEGPGKEEYQQVWLRIEVSDTGRGMSEEAQKDLFKPYHQLHSEESARKDGTGLGLTITQSLVQAMNGTISFESDPGKGTTFRVLIPVKWGYQSESETEPHDQALSGRVLVADDSRTNLKILKAWLTAKGMEVVTTDNGTDALEKLLKGPYLAAILDWDMPGLSGTEVAVKWNQREVNATQQTTLIGLTGYSDSDLETISQTSGFAYVLTKPVDFDSLLQILRTLVRKQLSD